MAEKKGNNGQDDVMNISESEHFLQDALRAVGGVDLYKADPEIMREIAPMVAQIRQRVEGVLQDNLGLTLADLDDRSPEELTNIRQHFLRYFRPEGGAEGAETHLKKWVPLPQMVGYMEVLVASAFRELNLKIDEDLRHTAGDVPENEYLRMRIVNAFKKLNQGKPWPEVLDEIKSYLQARGVPELEVSLPNWQEIFDRINEPLQEEYRAHMATMNVNEHIRDLMLREEKRSVFLQRAVGSATRRWKPADLEHDIHAQSEEMNRSLIELTCNAIDANPAPRSRVNVVVGKDGYTVEDSGTGMNPYVVLEKLLIPKISGKTGKETIGRFGIGFYTVLSHLKKKEDAVRIQTSDGKEGYEIEFRIHEGSGEILVHTERKDGLQRGTHVDVRCQGFDATDAEQLCRELLGHNARSEIIVNGQAINVHENIGILRGEKTSVQYAKEIGDEGLVSLLVNGVRIEQFPVKGLLVPTFLVLDFPLECSLPESRSQLAIDEVAIASIREMLAMISAASLPDQEKISLFNAITPVLKKLQERVVSNRRKDNLLRIAGEALQKGVEMTRRKKVFLPNVPAFRQLKIENVLYVDADLREARLEDVPGIERCERFQSSEGYTMYIADFHEDADTFLIEHGKTLIFDRKVYERYRETPAVLNVYLSNLDSTKTVKSEKEKGKFLMVGEEPYNFEFLPSVREDPVSREVTDLVYKGNMNFHFRHYLDEDQFFAFANSSESDRIGYILRTLGKTGNTQYASSAECTRMIEEQLDNSPSSLDFLVRAHVIFSTIRRHGKLIEGFIKNGRSFDWYWDLIAIRKQVAAVQRELADFEDSLAENCLTVISKFSDKDPDGSMVRRIILLFKKKIVSMSSLARGELVQNLTDKVHFALERNYNEIPRSVRGFFIYIVEGGEILEEKNARESRIERAAYQGSLPLSKMVQAKRGDEAYFQDFQGTPKELAEHCRRSQEGIDSSKAMRDIFHSAESQIVNDGYLWIREMLQNSIDAVQKERRNGGSSESARVGVDCYLRKLSLDVPEAKLWEILETEATALYPDSWPYFRQRIAANLRRTGGVMDCEHFPGVLQFLSELRQESDDIMLDLEQESPTYFYPSTIGKMRGEFERISTVEPDLVIDVTDPVGMNVREVINYLLIPNETTKKDEEGAIGKFGQGFFTIFNDAKAVLIKTSPGDGKVCYLRITPIRDSGGKAIDYSVEMAEHTEQFKGTTIQKIVQTDMPEVEAALCKSASISYGGLIDGNVVDLRFRESPLNAPRDVLAESQVKGMGSMRIYAASENAMTQNGLYIKQLDTELLDCIPESIRKPLMEVGIVLDLPPQVKLIKSRNDLAKKKEIVPLLQKGIPSLALQAYLRSFALGRTNLDNLPYGYFHDPWSAIDRAIAHDADRIAAGEILTDYGPYLAEPNRLIQLLASIPCIEVGGTRISFAELKRRFRDRPESLDLAALPEPVRKKIEETIKHQQEETSNTSRAQAEHGTSSTTVRHDFTLPDAPELRQRSSVLYAFDYVFQEVLDAINASAVQRKYYLQMGMSAAHAGSKTIAFNLDHLDTFLPKLASIIRQKLPVSNPEVQQFLYEVIYIITHERQHNKERSEDWTHNDEFFKGQREILTTLIKNGLNLEGIFSHIYANNTDTLLPGREVAHWTDSHPT